MEDKTIKTGFYGLDLITGGFRPGTLNVIAGRKGTTALAMNITNHIARNSGKSIIYFSPGTTWDHLSLLLLGLASDESSDSNSFISVESLFKDLSKLPIFIDNRVELSLKYIEDKFVQFVLSRKDVGLVFFDLTYLMYFPEEEDKQRYSDEFFKELKTLANQYGIPFVILTGVSEDAKCCEERTPVLGDLRYQVLGEIADTVMLVDWPSFYEEENIIDQDLEFEPVKLIVAKNAFGSNDIVINLKWDQNRLFFSDNGISRPNFSNPADCPFGQFTFRNYAVGECNRFAFFMAVSVAENLGLSKNNPFLLWGEPGNGKTHLLKAMNNALYMMHPEKKVVYTTCEQFTNDFIYAINHKSYNEFRKKYRTADILLFDDIQGFINKDGVQTEFYNTVQTLLDNEKQVVITTDRLPRELELFLDQTLATLLLSGVVVGIKPPDYGTRMEIIEKIIDSENVKLDACIVDYICVNVSQSVSRLICSMNIICSYVKQESDELLDEGKAKELLLPIGIGLPEKKITVDKIIDEAAKYYKTTREAILNGSKVFSDNPGLYASVKLCRDLLDEPEDALKIFGKGVSEYITKSLLGFKRQFAIDVNNIKRKLKVWQAGIG